MNRSNKKIKRGAGFTLIELLVVLGIASLLSAVAVPSYYLMRNNAALNSEVQNFISALRQTQNFAVSAQGLSPGHTLTIISNNGYRIDNGLEYYIENGINISGNVTQVTYNKLFGTTNCYPNDCTFIIGPDNHKKEIKVNSQGTVSITNL